MDRDCDLHDLSVGHGHSFIAH